MPLLGSRGAASLTGFGGLAKLGYLLRNSLRFRASGSTTLSRAPASAGNRKTWTMSFWFKRGKLGATASAHGIMGCYAGVNNDSNNFEFRFTQSDTLNVVLWDAQAISSAVFRDPAAWYHIVLVLDTTQAGTSSGSKIKLYVNGVLQSWASDSISSGISQDADLIWNSTTTQFLGRWQASDGGNYFLDGYMAEVNFVNGQALTPSSFGKTDAVTGQWIPIKFGGAYGTNGYYLPFTNTTSTSTLGNDFSGNGNTWTVNNFSLTAGATYDSMTDVPTLTSATAANYCVMNPLSRGSLMTPSNGNLQVTTSANGSQEAPEIGGTIAVTSGKWYWEITPTQMDGQRGYIGVGDATKTGSNYGLSSQEGGTGYGQSTGTYGYWGSNGNKYRGNGTDWYTDQTSYGNTYNDNDVIGIALDLDNGKLWFSKNGTWQASGDPVAGTNAAFTGVSGPKTPLIKAYRDTGVNFIAVANFGQQPFAYTIPSGYKALNTFNLP